MCIKITEKIPFENQVYHYCSLETFRLIVENKVLFMSGYHYMNDSSEEKYFLDVFDEEMKNLYDGLSDEEKANIESDDYMKKYMTRLSELYANVCFICCFSNIRDDLNQWRAYGDDGKGICIGFDKSFFEGLVKEGFFAENVTYKSKEELHSFISEKLISIKNEHSLITDSVKFTREVKRQIGLKRAKVKNPAFLAENEFRIGLYDSLSDDAIKQYVFDDIHIGATGLKQYMGNIYYLNLSFSVLLGLYVNTNLGGTSIRCFVDGLIEMRSAFFFTSKEPKPCIAIAFPSSSSCVMSDNKELISSEVSLIVYPSLSASSDVNSLLFILV